MYQHTIERRDIEQAWQIAATERILLLRPEAWRLHAQRHTVAAYGYGRHALALLRSVDTLGEVLPQSTVGVLDSVTEVLAVNRQIPDGVPFLSGDSP